MQSRGSICTIVRFVGDGSSERPKSISPNLLTSVHAVHILVLEPAYA